MPICLFCRQLFVNLNDLNLHLQQQSGRGNHPGTPSPSTTILTSPSTRPLPSPLPPGGSTTPLTPQSPAGRLPQLPPTPTTPLTQQPPTGPGPSPPPTGPGPMPTGPTGTPPTGPGPAPQPGQQPGGQGIIRVIVTDVKGNAVPNADIKMVELSSGTTYTGRTNSQGFNQQNVNLGFYEVFVEKKSYKKPPKQRTELRPVRVGTPTATLNFQLEEEKGGTKLQGWFPFFDPNWWFGKGKYEEQGVSWPRFFIAFGLTLLFYFAVYRPTFAALGQNLGFANYLIPIGFFFIMFFTVPPLFGKNKTENLVPFVTASILAIGTFISLSLFKVGRATFIQWGLPLAVYLFTFYSVKKGKGDPKSTIISVVFLIFIIGAIMLLWNLISSGGITKIDTYLKALDGLRLIGVPQDTIDNMKDGIRNVLSFLQFKGVEPAKPEAEKIGGYETIQLKFGSRYNNYIVPTLFARMEYALPVTIINPNTFASQVPPVKNVYIDEIFLMNKSNERIMCGGVANDSGVVGRTEKIEIIGPEEERLITLDFNGNTTSQQTPATGKSVDCREVLSYRTAEKPLFPVKVRVQWEGKDTKSKDEDCKIICNNVHPENYVNQRYGIENVLDTEYGKYISDAGECECKIHRMFNIMDDLCFMGNDKAKIELRSHYEFSVEGKGELILVQKESDRKLAPKPSITSGAGPLTVTTYFVPDVYNYEKPSSKVTMFIQMDNDRDGTAEITNVSIKDFSGKCSPDPKGMYIDKSITISCNATSLVKASIPGSFQTVPVIVDVDYTYSQTHSVSLNVEKKFIPESIKEDRGSDEYKQLNTSFSGLPYYCEPDLKIYDSGSST